jgi:hypothetical protein
MNKKFLTRHVASGILLLAACGSPSAMAATGPAQGETSGPASGTTTVPGTAVQKNQTASGGGVAAGAPGVEGKSGTEAGGKPGGSSSAGQPKSR